MPKLDQDDDESIVIDLRDLETADPTSATDEITWHGLRVARSEGPGSAYWRVKRLLDVVGVVVSIPVVVPILLLSALLIRLDSAGPVLYRQPRMGARRAVFGGRRCWEMQTFTCYKLRTMYVDSDESTHQSYMTAYIDGDEAKMLELRGGVVGTYKMQLDPRITRVGRVLRRWSLDELPQLWNVLTGHMSLVGPRPPLPYEVEKYQPHHFRRLASTPGITGWWQVNGRSETSFDEMLALDLEYLDRQSIVFDLRILARTLPSAVEGRGAG